MTLWESAAARTAAATAAGALSPIQTRVEELWDGGMRFCIREVKALAHKPPAPSAADPFLPYDPALFVADVGPRHVVLLNKYPVLPDHLLIVTRQFEEQTAPLTEDDFEVVADALAPAPALAFYNSGRLAGASQRHKHLQLVRLPLLPGAAEASFEALLSSASEVPFRQAHRNVAGRHLAPLYREMLEELDSPEAYNLLLTERTMMLVPRVAERFEGISVNALGFAGALLVKDEVQRDRLLQHGPMAALIATAGPA
ncbi:MAG: phosphorylase [Myxococcales bacterium]|nr:phosphorylase [Myxococcales bacterium]MCB9578407.1 phosphorylase [Polyangiaceae bacterium]